MTLTRKIGRGGSADIWLATQVHLTGVERRYAVKHLHPDVAGRPEYQRRLQRELEIGLEVSHDHPNLVTTRGVETLLGNPAIVFELVEGPSLAAVRDRLRHWHTIRCIAHDLLSALAYLARRRVLHRDVSAGNILLDRDGTVRLGDFGMATWADGDSWRGTHVGTRAYRAPETLAAGCYTTASDLYSLGRVLWELCTGDVDADELPKDTPGDLRAVLRGLLQEQPRRRWTAQRALARLGSLDRDTAGAEIGAVASAWLATWGTVSGPPGHDSDRDTSAQGTTARQASSQEPESHSARHVRPRRWASVHLAAAATAALLVGAGGAMFLAQPSQPREGHEPALVHPTEPRVGDGSEAQHDAPSRRASSQDDRNDSQGGESTNGGKTDRHEQVSGRPTSPRKASMTASTRTEPTITKAVTEPAPDLLDQVIAPHARSEGDHDKRDRSDARRIANTLMPSQEAHDNEAAEKSLQLIEQGGQVVQTYAGPIGVSAGTRTAHGVVFEVVIKGEFYPIKAWGLVDSGERVRVDVEIAAAQHGGRFIISDWTWHDEKRVTFLLRDSAGMEVIVKEVKVR
ncbi:serine/threonine-protein kinase [Haliangium sp.]